jgi:hypothetical protein
MVSQGKNTLRPPPRLTGEATRDIRDIHAALFDLYRVLAIEERVLTRLAAAEARLATIAQVAVPLTASPSYSQAEAQAALASIRDIVQAAGADTP